MNKLNKNFISNSVTVESMACTLTCSCKNCSVTSCSCTTISDYYAKNPLANSSTAKLSGFDYATIDNEVYEMHYLG